MKAKRSQAVLMARRLNRAELLRATALQAAAGLVLVAQSVSPAAAQPAPSARPLGGQVVAGAASIATAPTSTTITQSSNRAAIDWTSYNVGSNQTVTYQQPSPTAVTLNRVTGGDPSAIAGKITANGQVVLTNPNGITFYEGAQVNAQSVVVSAAGITNQNFMAGKMVFDQAASPNARIDNRGTITVKQAGLAALVGPSVANSGTINARLGQVVLAGAATHTLDMYGDGLVSIDVTKQVLTAPAGPGGKPVTALVTNTGLIQADGGVVQLSAKAADGVVQTLVRAGGHIQANTVGTRTGRIEIAGTGGSVVVEGRLSADGRAPGSTGGQIMVAGSDTTTLAAGSHVSADGHGGGGLVAVGTTLARAAGSGPAPSGTSARTVVASSARVTANATAQGNGGRVTVLSTQSTTVAGAVAARGGKAGGDGGTIELSGQQGFALTGTADTAAPHGAVGNVVLDPYNLTITSTPDGTTNLAPTPGVDPNIAYNAGGTTGSAYVTPAQIQGLTGNVHLEAVNNLTVASAVTYTGGALTLEAGNNLTVNAALSVPGTTLTLLAGSSAIPGYNPAGALSVQAAVSSDILYLNAGSGGISLGANVTAPGGLILGTSGAVIQTAGTVQTSLLYGSASSVSLTSAANQISGIGSSGSGAQLATSAGGVTVVSSSVLAIGGAGTANGTGIGVPAGQSVSIQADTVNLAAGAGLTAVSAPGGTVVFQPLTNGRGITLTSSATKPAGVLALTTAELGLVSTGTLQLGSAAAGDITLGQPGETIDLLANGNFGTLSLLSGGGVSQGGPLLTNAVAGQASNSVTLTNAANQIGTVGNLRAGLGLAVATSGDLAVTGTVRATGPLTLDAGNDLTIEPGAVLALQNGTVVLRAASPAIPGNPGTGTLTVLSNLAGDSFTLGAGTGGIALGASVSVPGSLSIATTGPLTQTAGSINAPDISGTAASVSLPSRGNAITGVASQFNTFSVTGATGDFLLVDSVPVTVGGASVGGAALSVQSGRTIDLESDSITIQASGGSTLMAVGGTIVLAPYTHGSNILLDATTPAGGLSVTTAELANVQAATLQLGTLDVTNTPTVGAITIGQAGSTSDLTGNGGFTKLVIRATGAVTQDGALGVGTVTGQAGQLVLSYGTSTASNFIQTLAGFTTTAGDLSLHTSSGLTVSGTVMASSVGGAAANITLSSSDVIPGVTDPSGRAVGMQLNASLIGAAVSLNSSNGTPSTSGGINQPAGTITAASLTGVGGFANINQPNQIGQLSDFATYQNLTVSTVTPLQVTGTVVSTTSAITLNAAGITQTPTSSLSAVELDGSSSATTLLANNSNLVPGQTNNAIQGIGYFTQSSGDFTLATSSTLALGTSTGVISAATGSLEFIADRVGTAGSPQGGISAPNGVVGFAPFTPSRKIELIGDTDSDPLSLSLAQTFINQVTAAQVIALGNAASTGSINIGNAGETIAIPDNAVLQLQTTAAVTQGVTTAGQNGGGTLALQAAGLVGSVGSLTLNAPANQIFQVGGGGTASASLSGLAATGSISIVDGRSLSLQNAISANAASGTLSVTSTGTLSSAVGPLTASAIALSGATGLTLGTSLTTVGTLNTVSLNSANGAVTQGAGTITTGTLTVGGQSVSLPSTGNAIATLGAASVSGPLTLATTGPLSVAGPVTATTFSLTATGGDVTVNGPVTVTTLATTLSGLLAEGSGGTVTAGTLSGSAAGVSLTGTNFVGSVGPFTATGAFTLDNGSTTTANSFSVAGNLTTGALTIANYGPVSLSGTIAAPSVSITSQFTQISGVNNADGTITQNSGSITAGSITLTAGNALTQSAGTLTGTGPAGSVSLTAQGTLSLGGVISAPAVNLFATTLGAAPGLITQTATGSSITGVVSGHSDTTVALNGANNAISGLNGFSSTGGFSLRTGGALTVTGTVSDATSISLTAGGDLALQAALNGGAATLTASGALTQTAAGVISGSSLAGSAASATLGAANAVATLDAFTTTGAFTLNDTQPVAIAGAVSVGNGQTLTLIDPGPTFATGGSLSAPSGTVVIAAPSGSGLVVGGPGGFTTQPAVTAQTLQLGTLTGGPVTIMGALELTSVTTLDLLSSGAITESGNGAIAVGTLTGQGASASLGGQNQVGTLGSFTMTGAFSLANAEALTVVGPVTAASVTLSAVTGMTLAGNISAPTITLTSTDTTTQTAQGITFVVPGPIRQTGGTLAGTTITITSSDLFSQTGGAVLGTPAGSVTVSAQGPLTLGGTLTGGTVSVSAVNKSAAGPTGTPVVTIGTVSQTGGTLTAGTLSVTGDTVALTQPGNLVGTLQSGTATGTTPNFQLTDAQGLTVGTLSAGQTTLTVSSGGLTVAGAVNVQALALSVAGAVTGSSGSSVTVAGALSGTAGSLALSNAVAVGTLGSFATTAGFTLVNGQALTVSGPVTDGQSVSLTTTTGGLALGGVVSAPSVSLVSAAAINQTGGTLTATTLTGSSAGTTSLTATGNQVGTLAGFSSAGGFSLTDGQALAVSGTVSDSTAVTLNTAGALSLGATVQTGALSLTATGAITQPGGSITASSLTGSGAGVALTAANSVATLASFASTGDFALTDSAAVAVTGPVSAGTGHTLTLTDNAPTFSTGGSLTAPGGTVVLQEYTPGSGITVAGGGSLTGTPPVTANTLIVGASTGGPITIAGAFNLSTVPVLDLESAGAITETAQGSIRVATLTGQGASAALGGANQIGTLASFTTNTGFTLVDNQAFTVAGPVTDGQSIAITTTAGALTLSGALSAPAVTLTSAAGISQTGGTLTATTLTGSSAGTAALTQTGNAIGTLAGFSSTGGFSLADGQALAVTGTVADSTAVTLNTAGALSLGATVQTGALSLTATGAITQPGGSITASTLTGSGAGATLTALGNAIATLSSFNSTGAFALTDGQSLAVSGPVAASQVALNVTGALAVNGAINGGPVSLVATGALTEGAGGEVTATVLSGSAQSASLGGANRIATLGSFTTTAGLTLTDGQALMVSGPVTDGQSVSLTTTTAGLTLNGTVSAPSVTLTSAGGISQTGGTLTATTLAGSSAGGTSLTAAGNAVATLAGFTTTGAFALTDGQSLAVSGPVSASQVGLTITGALAVNGAISGGPVSLVATGALSEGMGGQVTATVLTGSAQSASLGGANQVGTLGSFASQAGFTLNDGQALTVTGPVTDGQSVSLTTAGQLTLMGTVAAPVLSLTTSNGAIVQTAGALSAPVSVTLTSAGAISQTGGTIATATLNGSSAGATSLTAAGNAIGTLAGFAATGAFALTDGQGLAVSGPVSASQVALTVTGNLAVNGPVAGGPVSLTATGALSEGAGGQVTATVLTGSAQSASLGGANQVGTLGSFATAAGFTLGNAQALTVSGPVTDGQSVSLTTTTGGLVLGGTVSAPAVNLVSAAGVSQSGGTLTATTLTGSSAGTTSLTATGNAIGTLAGFSSAGGFSLVDGQALAVSGTLADSRAVSLNTSGALTLGAPVQTGALSLTATGAITQPGGSITASSLTGSGAGVALTASGNSVATLAAFASTGDFALTDSAAVTVTGPVSAGTGHTLTLTDNAPTFGTGGSLSAPGGTVALREYTPGSGITVAGGGSLTGTPPVRANTLVVGAPNGGPISIVGAFNLSTVSVLDLESAGAITETGQGAIRVATLTGQGASATLGGANQIGILASFKTNAGFTLTDNQTLTVAGPVTDGRSVSLITTTGGLTLGGSVSAPAVTLVSAAGISQTGGTLTATTLTGSSAGTTSLTQTGNAVGTLAGFSSAGGFNLVDGQALAVSGTLADSTAVTLNTAGALTLGATVQTAALSLTATGAITQPSGSITASSLTGSGVGATLTALGNAIATLSSFNSTGAFALTDGQSLTVSGPVSASQVALNVTGTLAVNGVVSGGPVSLVASGALTEGSGGQVTATVLSGSAQSASLSGANAVATLAGFTTTGAFALTDGQSLAVSGPVSASQVGLTITGALAVNGAISGGPVSLVATGALSEGMGGQVTATVLTGSAQSASLGGANQVGTLGSFASHAGFTLNDGQALTVTGPVTDGQSVSLTTAGQLTLMGTVAAPVLSLTTSNGAIVQTAGALSAPVSVTLTSAGAISQTGGTIATASLNGSSAGATSLTAAGNAIGTLAGFSSVGGFSLVDAQGLAVTGTVSDGMAVTLAAGGPLVLNASVQTGALNLTSTGAITQVGGTLAASSLTGSGAGVSVVAPGNTVATLAAFTSTGDFALSDSAAVTVTGPVSAAMGHTLTLTDNAPTFGPGGSLSVPGGTVVLQEYTPGSGIVVAGGGSLTGTPPVTAKTLVVGAPTGGPISIVGVFNLSTVPVLDLESGGAITETGAGAIRVATLTGQGANAALGGANQIGTLASFTTKTGFALVDGQTLTVAGPVTDGRSVSLTTSTSGLVLGGSLSAPTVTLASAAGINQVGGTIAAATLTGSAAGPAVLTATGNQVGTLAGFSSTGGFSLTDGQALTVTGTVSDGTAVTLAAGGKLALNATVQTAALSLTATGAITQPGGSITASSLGGSGAGVALTAAGNSVATLASFASTGDFALSDSAAVTVTGPVSAGPGRTLTLTDNTPTFGPGGSLSAPGGTVALQEYTLGSGITVAGGGLTGIPPVTAGTFVIGARTGGPITIAGALNLSAVPVLDLESGGAITETGAGAIQVATLTGHGASTALGGANQIGTLASFTTESGLSLHDTQSLALTGAQSASVLRLDVTGDLTLSSTITAPGSVTLLATGAITQPSGSIATATLTGNAASATLGSTGNMVGTLAGFTTTGDFTLFDGRSLLVSAPVDPNTVTLSVVGDLTLASSVTGGTIVLNATGAITETGQGQVVATTLTGSAGSATLTGSNQVAVLGNFTSTAGLLLSDGQALAVTGAVSDKTSIELAANGPITLSGTLSAPGVALATAGGGAISQSAGSVNAGEIVLLSAGGIAQTGGALVAGTGMVLTASGPITLGGTVNGAALTVTTPGSLTQTGGVLTASSFGGSVAGRVTLGTAGTATIGTVGNLASQTGVTLVDAGPLTLAGTLAAPTLSIGSVGSMTVAGGSLQTNAGSLTVMAGANGTGIFTQTGTTTVSPYSGALSDLRIALPASGGTLTLASLQAPQTDLVLSTGTGTATGAIDVGSLMVFGAGGTTTLTGQAAGRTGTDAAQISQISPQVSEVYTLNGCSIAAVTCTASNSVISSLTASITASLQASSVIRPDILTLDVLDLSVTRDRDDPTLQLPNISDRDY